MGEGCGETKCPHRGVGALAPPLSTGTTNNALVLNPSGGNVGVGTTAPGATLDVNGTTRINGSLTGLGPVYAFNTNAPLGQTAGNSTLVMQMGSGSSEANSFGRLNMYGVRNTTGTSWTHTNFMLRYEVDATNFQYTSFNQYGVGIGTTAPAHPLSVGSTYGIMTSATFTLAGSSSVNTGYTLPPGGLYQVTVTTNSPNGPGAGNSHWWFFGLVNFNSASFNGFPIIINSNNVSISVATNGQVTVSAPGGSGSFSWIISAVRLC